MSGWTTGFMMALGLAVAPVTAASQPNDAAEPLEPLTIEVVTANQARIPRETVKRAEQVATRIFLAAGIRLEWTNTAPDSVEPYRETAARAQPGAPTAATDQRETTIVLHVANYAALSRHILDGAKARVAKVYEVIGVRTEWVDSAKTVTQLHDGRLHLTVILLSRDMAETRISAGRITDHVLGQAHLASWRAYIFCDRIAAVPGAPIMFSISIGNVIAHEMGHLLLRANRHSGKGMMRANVDLHALDLQGFDKSQASSIRTMLLELTAGATAR